MDLVGRTSRGSAGGVSRLSVERTPGFFLGAGLRRWPRSGCGAHCGAWRVTGCAPMLTTPWEPLP